MFQVRVQVGVSVRREFASNAYQAWRLEFQTLDDLKGENQMRLGWDEIKRRSKAFSEDWADAHYEKGEIQPFYEQFFHIFGVKRRQIILNQ